MARVNFTGFDTGDAIESVGADNVTFETSTRLNASGYSLRVAPASSGTAYYRLSKIGIEGTIDDGPFQGFESVTYSKFHVYFTAFPASAAEFFSLYSTDIFSFNMLARINNSGIITLHDVSDNTSATSSTVVSLNTWTRIEILFNNTTGASELRINGSVTASASGMDVMGFDPDQWVVGRFNSFDSTTYTMFVEDFVIDNAAYPGDTRITLLVANANGTNTGWTASAGNAFECIDETPFNSADFITSGTPPSESSFQMTNTAGTPIAGSSAVRSVKAITVKQSNGSLEEV